MIRPRPLTLARRLVAPSVSALALVALAGPAGAHAVPAPAHGTGHHGPALHVDSIVPSGATAGGSAPIVVRFSQPMPALADLHPRPMIAPAMAGRWSQPTPRTLTFTPTSAQLPFTHVSVVVRAVTRDAAGAALGHPVTHDFTVADGSGTRLTQLLAQLGYLPAHVVPVGAQPGLRDAAAQHRAVFAAPRGRLVVGVGWPSALRGLVQSDRAVVLRGALMAFQAQEGLAMTGSATRDVWAKLIAARLHDTYNRVGYTYAYASENEPESLTIYHDGRVVARSAANTGIAASPTQTGTFPVYSRLRAQIMRGTDPDGAHYADPVQYVAYFNGGDAVHYIARADYGIPQSLGCVELPLAAAAQIWPYLTYGSLVTVAP